MSKSPDLHLRTEVLTDAKDCVRSLAIGDSSDPRTYLDEHPDIVRNLARFIRATAMENALEGLFERESQDECPNAMPSIVAGTSFASIKEELIALVEGKSGQNFDETVKLLIHKETSTYRNWLGATELEKSELERHLRRTQKLETVGTLAGGIAHDFNNILFPILGYIDMALQTMDETDILYPDLEKVLQATHRAKDLVERVLLFAKQGEKKPEPLLLQEQVEEALKLMRPSIPSTIEIRKKIDSSCQHVRADPTQIHQVIVNLCTNAWQAMADEGEGLLTIELSQVIIGERAGVVAEAVPKQPDLRAGDYVRLSVIDTGTGVGDANKDRVFEPFFTTKPIDKNTGLGLSVVHGIVRNHGGTIQIESEPGKGSSFHVYLPVSDDKADATDLQPDPIVGGDESILVVDDDTDIAVVVQRMLTTLGYKVETCRGGEEGLDLFRKEPQKFDLILSDLTMPGISGLDLAKQVQEIRPGFPTVLMTGYGSTLDKSPGREPSVRQVLGKPLSLQKVATTVRNILGPLRGQGETAMRVLVMDDEAEARELITKMLSGEGHVVTTANNGDEGLKAMEGEPEFDLVIVDILMPEKEGLETITELTGSHPDLKILAISGGGRSKPEGYLRLAKKFGANSTLEKPFSKAELLQSIHQLVK